MHKRAILPLLTAILFLTSCNTTSYFYKRGNYYKATKSAIHSLKNKPDNVENQEILKKAYPLTVQEIQQDINNMQYSKDPNKYYALIKHYEALNDLYYRIYHCPKAMELLPNAHDYIKEIEAVRELGAEEFYQLGEEYLAQNTFESARKALYYFENANNFIPNYKSVYSLMQEAEIRSIIQVIVQKPTVNMHYQISSDFFFNNLLDGLRRENYRNKINFSSYNDRRMVSIAHHAIILDFVDFSIGNSKEYSNTNTFTRDSVITGHVNIRGKERAVYGTVKAHFTENILEISSAGIINVKIIDINTNRIISQRQFSGEYIWTSVLGSYQGDDRALNTEQKRLCNRRPEPLPSPQDLFIGFTQPLYGQVLEYVTNFYRRY